MAWRNAAVRTLASSCSSTGAAPCGLTFQSGLERIDGRREALLQRLRLPVWLPRRASAGGARSTCGASCAPRRTGATSRSRSRCVRGPGHSWQRVAKRTTTGIRGYLRASVHVQRSGELRLAWDGHHSRAAGFRVRAASH